MNQIIFLSHFLDEDTPGYGGVKAFDQSHVSEISKGANSNSQKWILSNHVGTHIDLPSHFDDNGPRLEEFKASDWVMTRPYLLHINVVEDMIIEYGQGFDSIPEDCDMLIIKTEFQKRRAEVAYWSNGPGMSPEIAKWIRKNRPNIRVLGFDFISITSFQNRPLGRIAHKEFLAVDRAGTPLRVIEDMNLVDLNTSPKKVIIAPLLVRSADGAPVTVVAELS